MAVRGRDDVANGTCVTALKPQLGAIPLPEPTPESMPFWDGCQREELLFQRCAACARANFVPTTVCRACLSDELHWQRSSGRGAIYSWTVVWRPQTSAFIVPYAPIIVDVDEGYQMLSNLVGTTPDAIARGQRVEVRFAATVSGFVLPYFAPAASTRLDSVPAIP
jgi:uncharacterized OB-fold protein